MKYASMFIMSPCESCSPLSILFPPTFPLLDLKCVGIQAKYMQLVKENMDALINDCTLHKNMVKILDTSRFITLCQGEEAMTCNGRLNICVEKLNS
jgi:hypothetical protein